MFDNNESDLTKKIVNIGKSKDAEIVESSIDPGLYDMKYVDKITKK